MTRGSRTSPIFSCFTAKMLCKADSKLASPLLWAAATSPFNLALKAGRASTRYKLLILGGKSARKLSATNRIRLYTSFWSSGSNKLRKLTTKITVLIPRSSNQSRKLSRSPKVINCRPSNTCTIKSAVRSLSRTKLSCSSLSLMPGKSSNSTLFWRNG